MLSNAVVRTVTWILVVVTSILTLVGSTNIVDGMTAFWFVLAALATAAATGYIVQMVRGTLKYARFKITAYCLIALMNFVIAVHHVVQ